MAEVSDELFGRYVAVDRHDAALGEASLRQARTASAAGAAAVR